MFHSTQRVEPPFLTEFAMSHQYRWSTQVAGGLGDGDDDIAAGNAHGQGTGSRAGVRQRSDGGRDGSCSTGTGFAHSALVHAHPDHAVDRSGENLDVDALGKLSAVETHRRTNIQLLQRRDRQRGVDAGEMGIADVDRQPVEGPAVDNRLAGPEPVGLAHVDPDIGVGEVDVLHDHGPGAGQRSDDEFFAVSKPPARR